MKFVYAGFFLLTTSLLADARKPSDAILLSGVKTLTLRSGKQTAHRRVPAIPQLRCVGGNARKLHEVDVMRCTNVGSDYDRNDVQWTCQANLPAEFKLGSTEVMCEGFSSPDDPYVLKGSCGVEYKLILTELGEHRYGSGSSSSSWPEKLISTAALLFIIVVFAYIIWATCTGQNRGRRGGPGGGGPGGGYGGGWGYGGGGGDDPPPPYTPRANAPKSAGQSTSAGRSQQQGNQGGFWTNILTGAAAGYVAGRLGSGGQRHDRYARDRSGGPWGESYRPDTDGGFGYRPGRGGSSASGSTHQSTGFGGTTRR